MSSDREDLSFEGGQLTRKSMPNGERRTRMRLGGIVTVTVTEMPAWEWKNGVPWQEAHFHRRLTETYQVVKGWMLYIGQVVPAGYTPRVVEGGDSVTFFSPEPHLVLLGPDTVIVTIQSGRGIGNPDRGGQDWWPAGEEYKKISRNFGRAQFEQAKKGQQEEGIRRTRPDDAD